MEDNNQYNKSSTEPWVPFKPFLRHINKTLDDVNDFNVEIGSYLIMKDISFEFSCFIKKEKEDVYLNFPSPSSTHIDTSLCRIRISCGMLPNGIANNRINNEVENSEYRDEEELLDDKEEEDSFLFQEKFENELI